MAVVAVVTAGNVGRVLAGRRNAVVAAAARADDLRVVDRHCWQPSCRGVAILAEISRLYVVRVLARCIEAVVAAGTATRDAGVVEHDRDPGRAGVAVVTLFAGLRMPRWLAGCRNAVVAAAAATAYGRVIHVGNRAPRGRRMAVGTDLG